MSHYPKQSQIMVDRFADPNFQTIILKTILQCTLTRDSDKYCHNSCECFRGVRSLLCTGVFALLLYSLCEIHCILTSLWESVLRTLEINQLAFEIPRFCGFVLLHIRSSYFREILVWQTFPWILIHCPCADSPYYCFAPCWYCTSQIVISNYRNKAKLGVLN